MRNQQGSEIVESAVGLCLVIGTVVACFLLLINVIVLVTYKVKLAVVTTQVAAYASSLTAPSYAEWAGGLTNTAPDLTLPTNPFTQQSIAYANTLLANAGLVGASPPTITVVYDPLIYAATTATVNIQLGSLPLVGSSVSLPKWISLQDSAMGIGRGMKARDNFNLSVIPNMYPLQLIGPCYGFVPTSAYANAQNSMTLRPFNQSPQIVTLGIPSSGIVDSVIYYPDVNGADADGYNLADTGANCALGWYVGVTPY